MGPPGSPPSFGSQWQPEHASAVEWDPGKRITIRIDDALLARLDHYCAVARRPRAAAIRYLIANSLRRFEEELSAEDARPS